MSCSSTKQCGLKFQKTQKEQALEREKKSIRGRMSIRALLNVAEEETNSVHFQEPILESEEEQLRAYWQEL